jgi:peptide/nickel transport system substrate-binding protein
MSAHSSRGGSANRSEDASTNAPRAIKRITMGATLEPDPRPTARGPAIVIHALVRAGLTIRDGQALRHPMLAEQVPTLENGLWALNPDGTMITTYHLRDGASWHDGAPFTADDVVFSLQVGRDRVLSAFNDIAYSSIDTVAAPDARTVVVTWARPFIDADGILGDPAYGPLPVHLLGSAYETDKAGFLDLPYWIQDYVGTGPFKVSSWNPGVDVQLVAYDGYVLGRPKIDEIDIRFIPDSNALLANFLSGAVQVSSMLNSPNDGLELRDQWRDGSVAFNLASGVWVALFPQFIEPSPTVLSDVRFRTAMAHGVDRQAIADASTGGISPVPLSFLNANQPQYAGIEATLPRYEYDPSRAGQILADLGYGRGGDGMYRDAAGHLLEIGILSAPADSASKPAAMVASYWNQLGVGAVHTVLPPQRVSDFPYIATWPGYLVFPRPNDILGMRNYQSANTMLPSNGFRVSGSGNTSRYMSPELDSLIDKYFATIPLLERLDVLSQIVHTTTDQITATGLYYYLFAGAISSRVTGVSTQWWNQSLGWNAQEWDLRD